MYKNQTIDLIREASLSVCISSHKQSSLKLHIEIYPCSCSVTEVICIIISIYISKYVSMNRALLCWLKHTGDRWWDEGSWECLGKRCSSLFVFFISVSISLHIKLNIVKFHITSQWKENVSIMSDRMETITW